MTNLVKSTVLSLGLVAGVSFAAYAQSGSVAALPPGTAATPPAAVAPSGTLPGPNAGGGWYPKEAQTDAARTPSPQYVGPAPGGGWYPSNEKQTETVQPSGTYPGPRPN
ncbi:MAG TPA: hypothetical protein VGQ90_01215 [Stellaceae bacterium]|jgi:hypothetical protein|nr:hypothetical protein [Stellaceae bacterium]